MSGSCSCDMISTISHSRPDRTSWQMIEMGLTYWMVRDEVVDIVAALPPTNGEATTEVGNKHSNQGVSNEVMGDASMACIVSCEHDLMLLLSERASPAGPSSVEGLPRTSLEKRPRSCTIHISN